MEATNRSNYVARSRLHLTYFCGVIFLNIILQKCVKHNLERVMELFLSKNPDLEL